ncbi:MAG: SDR family NAD(P)-dependent oxidoreductase [Planctomycetota bacterium JB042]
MTDITTAAAARRFADKVVLVTGVGSGAGRATALRFGLEGAKVVAVARSDEHVLGVRQALEEASVEHRAEVVDVSTVEGARQAVSLATEAFSGLDVLVCTAGGFEAGSADDADGAALDRMLDVNLRPAFETSIAAAPEIAKRGRGAIVITTAVFGAVVPGPGLLAYNTSKAASTGFVKSLAGDLAEKNVRVNAILPGGISHEFDPSLDPSASRALTQGPALPHDIAAAACFLASEDACWVTGASLVVDGGFSVVRRPY